jgi:hypothetical protein
LQEVVVALDFADRLMMHEHEPEMCASIDFECVVLFAKGGKPETGSRIFTKHRYNSGQ